MFRGGPMYSFVKVKTGIGVFLVAMTDLGDSWSVGPELCFLRVKKYCNCCSLSQKDSDLV